jgi:DNA-directed RNA polymerase specialized sigma24 family protein
LLVTITLNKARNAADRHFAVLRDVRRERHLPLADASRSDAPHGGSDPLAADSPTPAEVAELADELEHRLRSLETADDPDLRSVAELKLEGFTNREIADRLKVGPRTVERKLGLIRRRWASAVEGPA